MAEIQAQSIEQSSTKWVIKTIRGQSKIQGIRKALGHLGS